MRWEKEEEKLLEQRRFVCSCVRIDENACAGSRLKRKRGNFLISTLWMEINSVAESEEYRFHQQSTRANTQEI